MADQLATPRITSRYLNKFVSRHVMLVGRLTQLGADQVTLDSDGAVTLILHHDSHLVNGNAVQVIGKVNPDLTVKVLSAVDLGPEFVSSSRLIVSIASHLQTSGSTHP